ncbi:tRNA pseudouridine(38-40) synthase TruA [Pelagibacteraceae bacterium]|nr:tRNA pseudouridine(38-40) synthase TruA [Pelagibacteraceae bacterium]
MFNYQIISEYDGTNFVGWQKQKNGSSIQQTIEKVFTKILKKKIILYGSGRTDSGVHAQGQSAHFNHENKIDNKFIFLNSVNFFLNKKKISILKIEEKNERFHARFSAIKREYRYIIVNRIAPLSLDLKRAWHIKFKLNLKLMKTAINLLKGKKDFSTFRSSSCNAKSPIKILDEAKVIKSGNKIIIIFKSKSFLQQQVRSMVGCLKYVGEKKWNIKKFKNIINSKKRINCAPPAPAHGLYLYKVSY